MAADVSSLVRILNGYKDDRGAGNESAGAKSAVALTTRDLLGGGVVGGGGDQSQELDLDLQVPTGWEKRLDLKSGKVYLQRCNSASSYSISSASFPQTDQSDQTVSRFQDLNVPPASTIHPAKPLLNLFDDTNLELKLVSSSMSSLSTSSSSLSVSSNSSFHSVCTLDKVKSALERVEKDPSMIKKRQSPSSSSSSMMKEDEDDDIFAGVSSPVAAGCPGCLSYVLVMKNNPKCPRCNSFVPLPAMKKPKIDLNISI